MFGSQHSMNSYKSRRSEEMNLADKLLWDRPYSERRELAEALEKDPVRMFNRHNDLFVKVLNTFSWYELVELLGMEKLHQMLTDDVISKVFPAKRREYYKNARRLLSKFSLSTAG
jgi:hypothetical protein